MAQDTGGSMRERGLCGSVCCTSTAAGGRQRQRRLLLCGAAGGYDEKHRQPLPHALTARAAPVRDQAAPAANETPPTHTCTHLSAVL